MSQIVTENLPAPVKTEDKDSDCDKDSGNQSGEEMETTEEGSLQDNQNKENGERRNSIAEELKAKIASVSRRNSWTSSRRGSNAVESRRGSIQSIKEDPICEEVCEGLKEGQHCHLENSEEKTDPAPKEEDPTCTKELDCVDSVSGSHCHLPDVPGEEISKKGEDHDVTPSGPPVDASVPDNKKQISQTIPPAEAESGEALSTNSTPLTARKVCQTPVNMKEKESLGVEQTPAPVVSTMPPTEHQPSNTENNILNNTPHVKERSPPAEKNERSARAQSKTIWRSRSKSRAASPSSEARKSRLSSKERKSKYKSCCLRSISMIQ